MNLDVSESLELERITVRTKDLLTDEFRTKSVIDDISNKKSFFFYESSLSINKSLIITVTVKSAEDSSSEKKLSTEMNFNWTYESGKNFFAYIIFFSNKFTSYNLFVHE